MRKDPVPKEGRLWVLFFEKKPCWWVWLRVHRANIVPLGRDEAFDVSPKQMTYKQAKHIHRRGCTSKGRWAPRWQSSSQTGSGHRCCMLLVSTVWFSYPGCCISKEKQGGGGGNAQVLTRGSNWCLVCRYYCTLQISS